MSEPPGDGINSTPSNFPALTTNTLLSPPGTGFKWHSAQEAPLNTGPSPSSIASLFSNSCLSVRNVLGSAAPLLRLSNPVAASAASAETLCAKAVSIGPVNANRLSEATKHTTTQTLRNLMSIVSPFSCSWNVELLSLQ